MKAYLVILKGNIGNMKTKLQEMKNKVLSPPRIFNQVWSVWSISWQYRSHCFIYDTTFNPFDSMIWKDIIVSAIIFNLFENSA